MRKEFSILIIVLTVLVSSCSSTTGLTKIGNTVAKGAAFCSLASSSGVKSDLKTPVPEPIRRSCALTDQITQACEAPEQAVKAHKINGPKVKDLKRLVKSELRFPLPTGCLSSPFGYRHGAFHNGIDITDKKGAPIYAAAEGIVTASGFLRDRRGLGLLVVLDHGNGVSTHYGHVSRILVRPGQKISRGDKIALVGSTGRSTSPHLHFEVKIGPRFYDPMTCFAATQLNKVRVASSFYNTPKGRFHTSRKRLAQADNDRNF
ncbi:MAG: M23 family metallopeptidase [Syntrophaceae bacterium]|nr:M23 family metallopeptidase [Syntrophaceae bacterium]